MPNGSKSLKIAARFLPDAGLEPGEASPKYPRSSALDRSAKETSLRTFVEKATYEPRAPHFVGYVPDGVHFGWRNGFRQIDSGHVSGHFEQFENNFFFRQISALAPWVCDSGGWQARSNCLVMYSTTSFRWHDGFLAVCPKTPFQGTILDAFRILTLSLFDSGGWHLRRRCSSMSSITYSRWQFDWYGAGRVTNGGIFLP